MTLRNMFRSSARLSCALLALTVGGCGWIVGEIAEQMHKQRAIEKHVYEDVEIDELWRQINDLWVTQGCEPLAAPQLATTHTCEGGEPRWVRVDTREGGFHVEFEHEEEIIEVEAEDGQKGPPKKERVRDWQLEWTLLERVDFDTAKAIEAEAQSRNDKARKATRDLDEALSPSE